MHLSGLEIEKKMEINRQKALVSLIVVILIAFISLIAAAPVGISESAVVETAKIWIGVDFLILV
jgi:hypothetical protein